MSTPVQHVAIVSHPGINTAFIVCCANTERHFEDMWGSNPSSKSAHILGSPGDVLNRIAKHLIDARHDQQVADVLAAARLQTALTKSAEEGLSILNEQLPGITITFERYSDPEASGG